MAKGKKVLLHGTYKNQVALYNDIFPLKKYKFYNHEIYGPKSYELMIKYYGKDCLTRVKVKWGNRSNRSSEKPFLFDKDKHKLDWSYESNTDEAVGVNFCTADTKACQHLPTGVKERYIFDNGFPTLRPCCFNKKNKILVDTCAF